MARAKSRIAGQKANKLRLSEVTVKEVTKTLADVEMRVRACRRWVAAQPEPEGASLRSLSRTLKEVEQFLLKDVEERVCTVRRMMMKRAAAAGGFDKSLISAGNC